MTSILVPLAPIVFALAPPQGQRLPIRIDLDAPRDCARVEQVYAGIHSRLEEASQAAEGEKGVLLRMRVMRSGGRVKGELDMSDDQGNQTSRAVDGDTCEQVVEALSLTAVLALERTRARPSPPAPLPPAPLPPPLPPPPPAPQMSRSFAVELGARAFATEVVTPFVTLGGEIFARLRKAPDAPASPNLELAVVHARNDFFPPANRVFIRWTGFAFTACPYGWGLDVRIEPCLTATGGWLEATDQGIDRPDTALRSWWSVGARLRAGFSLGRGYWLEAQGGVSIPVIRRRFVTDTINDVVGQTPRLSAIGGLGVSYRF